MWSTTLTDRLEVSDAAIVSSDVLRFGRFLETLPRTLFRLSNFRLAASFLGGSVVGGNELRLSRFLEQV
jgi:hypothetical protein